MPVEKITLGLNMKAGSLLLIQGQGLILDAVYTQKPTISSAHNNTSTPFWQKPPQLKQVNNWANITFQVSRTASIYTDIPYKKDA